MEQHKTRDWRKVRLPVSVTYKNLPLLLCTMRLQLLDMVILLQELLMWKSMEAILLLVRRR